MNKKTAIVVISTILVALTAVSSLVYSHCQIPCGIYDDQVRFQLMGEHITTIEKSMKQITSLMEAEPPNANQVVRWVDNKEAHADELSEIATQYFLAQRVKPAQEGSGDVYTRYIRKLTLIHGIVVESMKAKQSTDLSHVENLRRLVSQFEHVHNSSK